MWSWICACVCVFLAVRYYLRSLRVTGYSDKYVLITGCDTGFGNGLAKRLNKDGFNVIAGCLTEAGVEELTTVSSGKIVAVKLDITNDQDIQSIADKVTRILPENTGLWALVNNAGILGSIGVTEYLTKRDFLKVMEVNLFGHIEMVNRFLPLLRMRQGRILMMSSVAGRIVTPPMSCYAVSKFALEAYSDCLRNEQSSSRISVHIIEPSGHNTAMIEESAIRKSIGDTFARARSDVKEFYGANFPTQLERRLVNPVIKEWLLPGPYPVVDVMADAISARYPRARYSVGVLCWLFIPLSFLPEFVGDCLIRATIPRPGSLL